jgi:hypothetical protein
MLWIPFLRRCSLACLAAFILVTAAGCRPASAAVSAQLPVKLQVGAEGIYSLDAALLSSLGLKPDQAGQLVLSYRGQPLPLVRIGDGLSFYIPPEDSQASPRRYAILELAESARERTPAVGPPPETGAAELVHLGYSYAMRRFEDNLFFQPQANGGERWFWMALSAGQMVEAKIALPSAGGGGGRLRMHVWGSTSAPVDPDHHMVVEMNGVRLLDETWDGAGRQTLEALVPSGVLLPGENTIRIELPGDTGAEAELAYLDWIELDYAAELRASQDRLVFTSAGGEHTSTGFSSSPQVWDVTEPYRPTLVSAGAQPGFLGDTGRRYWLAGLRGALRPEAVLPLQEDEALLEERVGADYLVIGSPDLLAPLEPLLAQRQAQGWVVRTLPVEVVYDTFNAGNPEPEAIQALVRASRGWEKAPQALLLVGDATYDPFGYQNPLFDNHLPTFWVDTVYGGQTASDLPFALPPGEDSPSLAVGRLPARTPDQVVALVEKILAYETGKVNPGSPPRILAVVDPSENYFQNDAQAFLDGFGPAYQAELLIPNGESAMAAQVVEAIQRSGGIVSYFGHGSLNMWGKDRLFSVDEAAELQNGERLPVFVTLTCLNGLFTHPKQNSLAEALIWQPQGGAVAVLAPTSLTLANDQALLSSALVQAVREQPDITLGEALLAAQRSMDLITPGRRDVLYTFLLFGDPLMAVFPPGP